MTFETHFLTENDCYQAGKTIVPKGIMVHSLGVAQPNPAVFLTTWNRPKVPQCVHAFVDTHGVTQTLPWTMRGWHAGGKANNTHIGFELCEPAGHTYHGGTMVGYDPVANRDYFAAVYRNAVALCVLLCRQFQLNPITDIICHSEGYALGLASNHADVMHWFPQHGKTMQIFRAEVLSALLLSPPSVPLAPVGPPPPTAAPEGDDEMIFYETLADVPIWGKPTVEKLLEKGFLLGTDGGLRLEHSLLRGLVINDRAGLYH